MLTSSAQLSSWQSHGATYCYMQLLWLTGISWCDVSVYVYAVLINQSATSGCNTRTITNASGHNLRCDGLQCDQHGSGIGARHVATFKGEMANIPAATFSTYINIKFNRVSHCMHARSPVVLVAAAAQRIARTATKVARTTMFSLRKKNENESRSMNLEEDELVC